MDAQIIKINANDEVFNNPSYVNDRLIFNYIEGARQYESTQFYSDGKTVIICNKDGNNSVWIWTADDVHNDIDSVISIAKAVREFDIPNLEFFTKPQLAPIFSDMYALVSKELDYQVKSEFSLGVYKFNSHKLQNDDSVTVLRYNKKYSNDLLQFYMDLKDEFCWTEDKVRNMHSKYSSLNTYLLLKNGKIISVCVICDDDGDCSSVRSVATKPEYRNHGYATLVTNIAAVNCEKGGNERIMLYANNGNKSAVATFKKAGFEQIGNIHLIKS